MQISAIIQSRMSSHRFPGKMMYQINGKPLIEYVIQRVRQSKKIDNIIVATSLDDSDDLLEEYCHKNNYLCYRGSLENVAKRFYDAVRKFKLDGFIRINGDSPFIDARIIDEAIKIFHKEEYDIVTNVLKRTFPKGQSVEIFKSNIFLNAFPYIKDPFDLEHVAPFFYKNAKNFRIFNITSGRTDYSHVNLCIDTPQDLHLFKSILSQMKENPVIDYYWKEIVELYQKFQKNSYET